MCGRWKRDEVNPRTSALDGHRDILVVVASVDAPPPYDERSAMAVLDEDERARTARFVHVADRRRFVVAHGLLRHVVAEVLDTAPARVPLTRTGAGAPAVGHGLFVSLTHSGDRVACALARRPVGIDLEQATRDVVLPALVRRFCTPAEIDDVAALGPDARAVALLRLWVRKEAIGKALGTGLDLPLNTIDARRRRPRSRLSQARRLHVVDLDVDSAYVAAVAVRSRWPRLQVRVIAKQRANSQPKPRTSN